MSFMTTLEKKLPHALKFLRDNPDKNSEDSQAAFYATRLIFLLFPRRRVEIFRAAKDMLPRHIGSFCRLPNLLSPETPTAANTDLADALFEYFDTAFDQEPNMLLFPWQNLRSLYQFRDRRERLLELCQRRLLEASRMNSSKLQIEVRPLEPNPDGSGYARAESTSTYDDAPDIAFYASSILRFYPPNQISEDTFRTCADFLKRRYIVGAIRLLKMMAGNIQARREIVRGVARNEPQRKLDMPEKLRSELSGINPELLSALLEDDCWFLTTISSLPVETLRRFVTTITEFIETHVNTYKTIKSERQLQRKLAGEAEDKGEPVVTLANWLTRLCPHCKDCVLLSEIAHSFFRISTGLEMFGPRNDLNGLLYDTISAHALKMIGEMDPRQGEILLETEIPDPKKRSQRVRYIGSSDLITPSLATRLWEESTTSPPSSISVLKVGNLALSQLEIMVTARRFLTDPPEDALNVIIRAAEVIMEFAKPKMARSKSTFMLYKGALEQAKRVLRILAEEGRVKEMDQLIKTFGEEVLP